MLRRHRHQELEDKVWRLTADLTALTERMEKVEENREQKQRDEIFRLAKLIKAKAVKIAAKVE